MIWATVSSWSCFLLTVYSFSIFGCKEYNQSDFNVGQLVMSMCRVFFCVVGRGCLLWPVHSWQNSISLCPDSFCTPRPNLPVTPGKLLCIFWLPTFAFKSPILKRTSFLGVSSRRSCRSSKNCSTSAFSAKEKGVLDSWLLYLGIWESGPGLSPPWLVYMHSFWGLSWQHGPRWAALQFLWLTTEGMGSCELVLPLVF